MGKAQLYPLRFDPIYQYRLWGGRRFASLLSAPLPGDGPVGHTVARQRALAEDYQHGGCGWHEQLPIR